MGLQADVFWSFRSPYSYLATRRYRALMEEFDLTINLRPVYPLAIRDPDFSNEAILTGCVIPSPTYSAWRSFMAFRSARRVLTRLYRT